MPASLPGTSTPSQPTTCSGCGSPFHPGGRKSCPAFKVACHHCTNLATSPGCTSPIKHSILYTRSQIPTNHNLTLFESNKPLHQASTPPLILNNITEPAPTINIHVNGSASMVALPDYDRTEMMDRNGHFLHYNEAPGTLAQFLARDAVFGPEVMRKCTPFRPRD